MSATAARSDRPLLALAWMTGSSLGFSVMSIFVKKLATAGVPQFDLVFFRSSINFAIVLAIMLAARKPLWPGSNKRLLVFRGLAGFAGVSCLFYGISHLPLSVAAMINWSSPIWVILFSWVFLDERLRARALAWIGLAFTGLLLLLRPDFRGGFEGLAAGAVGVAMLGAMFGGLAYVAVRAATARVGVNTIILYFTGISTLLSAPWALSGWEPKPMGVLLQLVLVGVFASIGQFFMTQGYRHAAAGLVSTMGLLNAAFSLLFGWALFGERLAVVQWVGMALLMLGVSAIALSTRAR